MGTTAAAACVRQQHNWEPSTSTGSTMMAGSPSAMYALLYTSCPGQLPLRHEHNTKINSKLHDGVCQHCKDVLEWRVKFSKYKPLSQPKKCVKCLQKSVRDAYHIICKPCAIQLEICAKCGKKEDIVVPVVSESQKDTPTAGEKADQDSNTDDDLDFDIDLDASDDERAKKNESSCKNTTNVNS
ncbi:uncharacterized protein C9orf85 homolog isoform X1 [Pyxicephalus adspersus]|uniref:uncharacterized protein C9orf85 homolog isoform X1 n=1 Tax=Pyxicephalus adspersus TaxID=30357 RepID=UPI003B5B798A